ncbi:hypothetical protein HYQ44_016554 [Verticillium longisporum]|nr:hypothetical protein HYQ44_016554 [Verticillium longisporum]
MSSECAFCDTAVGGGGTSPSASMVLSVGWETARRPLNMTLPRWEKLRLERKSSSRKASSGMAMERGEKSGSAGASAGRCGDGDEATATGDRLGDFSLVLAGELGWSWRL